MQTTNPEFDEVRSSVREAGYLQLEGQSGDVQPDFGEALRIACENDNLNCGERMVGWIDGLSDERKSDLEKDFNEEFGIVVKLVDRPSQVTKERTQLEKICDAVPGASMLAGDQNSKNSHANTKGVFLASIFTDEIERIDPKINPVAYCEMKEKVAEIMKVDEDDLGVFITSDRVVFYNLKVVQSVKVVGDRVLSTMVGESKRLRRKHTIINFADDLDLTPRFPSEMYEAEMRVW